MMTEAARSSLLGEMVALFLKWQASDECDDANYEAEDALVTAIVTARGPQTVGDVMKYEHHLLKWQGLKALIERDAVDHFDQIDGYLEWTLDSEGALVPECASMNGLDLCNWIDANFPVVEEAGHA